MTPDDLRAWQTRMGLTTYSAPAALGVSRSTYNTWLSGERPVTLTIALACAALEAGLPPIGALKAKN